MLWDKSLETGVPSIDTQHKELFRRVEQLLDVSNGKQSKEKIKETMDFLGVYIVQHFRDEEALQKNSNYSKAVLHKSYHDQYIKSFEALKAKYQAEGDSLSVVLSINRNVVDWLVNHINVHDKEFAEYYRSK